MTGVTGGAITGFCLGCGAGTSASLSAALGVPISSSLLASLGLPSWLGWAEDMLRAVTVLFLALAGYGIYREREKAIPMGNVEPAAGRNSVPGSPSKERPSASARHCDARDPHASRDI